ncbi:hypothetical protein ABPG75_012123 [Micractinium tetrahymenae]
MLSCQLAPAAQQAATGGAAAEAAWQRRRYWYQPAPHHLLSSVVVGAGSFSFSAAFEVALGRPVLAFLWEHQVQGRIIVPGAAMLEASRAAAQCLLDDAKLDSSTGSTTAALCGISIPAPLPLPGTASNGSSSSSAMPLVRCVVSHGDGGRLALQLQSRAAGRAPATNIQAAVCSHVQLPVTAAEASMSARRSVLLQRLTAASLVAASRPAPVAAAACGSMDLRGQLAAPGFHFHPAAIDAATHFGVFAVPEARTAKGAIGSHAVQLRVPAGAAYFHAPRQGTAGGACWPVMSSSGGGEAAASSSPLVSFGLLHGAEPGSSAACQLCQLQLKSVSGQPAAAASKAATSMASYQVDLDAHSVADQVSSPASGCAVSLSGQSGSVRLLGRCGNQLAVPAAVWSAAQRVLRFLQQHGSGSLQLASAVQDSCSVAPVAACAASTAAAAAVQGLLRCAAAEGRELAGSVTTSTLAAGGLTAAAPASDVFLVPHLQQRAWLLAQLRSGHQQSQPSTASVQPLSYDGSAAISGGTGALGLLVAAWMAAQDASRAAAAGPLCLWARSAAVRLPAALVSSRRLVSVVQCDAAAAADVAAASHGQQRDTSVFVHAGGVLHDAMLAQQTASRLRAALAPKLSVLQLARAALAAQPMQRCLLFSSAAALLGNAGQANYAAANAALDAAAAWQQLQGTTAVSLQWGPWAGGGMATAAVAARLEAKGVGLVQPHDGLRLLSHLVNGSTVAASTAAALAPLVAIDWRRMLSPAQQRSPFFAAVLPPAAPSSSARKPPVSVQHMHSPPTALLQPAAAGAAAPAGPSMQHIQEQLLALVAGLIGGSMEPTAAFMSAGLDSLGSLELRNAVAAQFGVELPATVTFDYPTPASLAAYVHSQLLPASKAAAATPEALAPVGQGGWEASTPQGGRRGKLRPRADSSRLASSGGQSWAAAVLQKLTEMAAGVLGSPPPAEQPLMEAGLDSLGAVELRNAVGAAFGLQLPATVTFDYPTLASLAGYVADNMAGAGGELEGAADTGALLPAGLGLLAADDSSAPAESGFTALVAASGRYPAPSSGAALAAGLPLASPTAGPGNADLAGFQAALAAAANIPSPVPPQRWDIDACYSPDAGERRMYVRLGGWLDSLAAFDAAAFRLSTSEAACLDPQARMLLEHTHELLVPPASAAAAPAVGSSVGVYVGCMYTEYLDGILGPLNLADSNSNAILGRGLSFLVGRASYTFGLQGPCVSTDTACSSSLVALHQAHSGVLAAECAAAVTGGVQVNLIAQQQLLPMVNLREVNPYVTAALGEWRSRHSMAAAPSRQSGAAANLVQADAQLFAGTSSFGMSGVNAHALLSMPESDHGAAGSLAAAAAGGDTSWQPADFWPRPIPHPLLLAANPSSSGGRMAECVAEVSAASLAWMHDHAVHGRALLPAAAMFELAAAAAAACGGSDSGSGAALPALASLAVLAPCFLPGSQGGSFLLRCTIDGRTGALQVLSGAHSLHLQAVAASQAAVARQQATATRTSNAAALLMPLAPAGSQGHNLAVVGASKQETAGYFLHPGTFDASIHLAPVPTPGGEVVSRVPVAAGCLLLPPRDGKPPSGWAAAEVRGINPQDLSASNNIRWLPGSLTSGMCLAGLVSKVAPARPAAAAVDPAVQLLYSVSWQAHSSSGSAAVQLSSRRSGAGAVSWSLQAGGAGMAQAVAVQAGSESDAGFAAAHLQFMQQAVRDQAPRSSLHLHTPASVVAQPAAAGSGTRRQQQQQAAVLLGLVKVAALDAEHIDWAHSSSLPQQLGQGPLPAQQLPFTDMFGPSQAGGAFLAPRLLPDAAPPSMPTQQAVSPVAGACLVTGGLGALGTLIASQQLAAGSSGGAGSSRSPHIILLGRSISVSLLEAALGSAWRRATAAGSGAQLTVASCDASAAADVAGLADRLSSGGVRVGSVMHSAGVLKDAVLSNQTASNLRASLAAKPVAARWLQRRLAAASPAGQLVLFSSIAGLLGSGGQASYAAANSALDALADSWQEQGVASCSIAWGSWGGAGMAAGDAAVAARLQRLGIVAIQPAPGLAALEQAVSLSVAAGSGTVR